MEWVLREELTEPNFTRTGLRRRERGRKRRKVSRKNKGRKEKKGNKKFRDPDPDKNGRLPCPGPQPQQRGLVDVPSPSVCESLVRSGGSFRVTLPPSSTYTLHGSRQGPWWSVGRVYT